MSEPTGARRYGVGGGDAYYDAVRYGGYEGTREQFGKDQAEFAQNAAAVAEAKETVERDTEEVRNTKNTFENTTVPEAIRALEQESEDQILAITQKGEEVSQQVETVGTEQKDAVANEGRARVRAVEQAGTDQVQAVNDAGTIQVGNVNQAGEDQIDAVERAGAVQVQAVIDEGDNQVQRVQDKGDEVLASIPEDYTALDQEVDNLNESVNNISVFAENRTIEWQIGKRIATNTRIIDITAIYSSPAYSCQVLAIKKNETFYLTAHASNAIYNAYCFTDENRRALAISGAGTFEEYEIVAPSDGYLIVCTDDNTKRSLKSYDVLPDLVADNKILMFDGKNIETLTFPESFFEQGTFGSTGTPADSNYAIRTKEKIPTSRPVKLIPQSGYRVFVVKYSKDGVYESQTDWQTTEQTVSADKQFRFAISHTKPTALTAVSEHGNVIAVNASYDEYLLNKKFNESEAYNWDTKENEFRFFADRYSNENNDLGRIYHVGAGRDYTTIAAAISAWAADNYPEATIFIDNGEYNEAITVTDKTVRFVGESRTGTIIHTTSGAYTDAPFTINHGTVTIQNMTLIADHSENPDFDYEALPSLKAYGIHIDGGSVGGIVTVENCTIISFQAPAVGTGTIPNSKIRLVDCDCYCFTDYTADTTTNQYSQLSLGCILWHTSNPENYPDRGTEEFELVNVKAYMKNNYVVFKTNKSAPTDTMDTLAINTLLLTDRNPNSQNPVSGPAHPVQGSIGNSESVLNYSGT